MKHTKSLLVAALAVLSVGAASADTIYITGSTAFRKAANASIGSYVDGKSAGSGIIFSDTTGANPVGATDIAWQYVTGGSTNYIVAHWSGSEGGIQNTAAPAGTKTYNYVNLATATLQSPASFATGVGIAGATNSGNVIATNGNIVMADTTQASSLFKNTYAGTTYTGLNGSQVGVVTFAWVVNSGANSGVTNMTSQNARAILTGGFVSAAMLTGSSSDTNDVLWLIGRDIDSGTRLTTLGETGFGTTKAVKQYFIGYGGTTTNNVYLTPATSINGVTEVKGNAGYTSGSGSSASGLMYQIKNYGILASGTALTVDTNSTANTYTGGNYLIGYAGTGDCGKVSASPVRLLSYNGVPYSDGAVYNGQYTFWGYENLYYNASTVTANTVTVATALISTLQGLPTGNGVGTLQNAGVPLSSMVVARGSDFAVVTQNY